ncbi:hypothetical protein [Aquibium oceanicum]|uniref:Uncharacterized protein n=1 Tax=Aquibium oceanicum TaxID=1670800 RepID=A0A1L3SNI9_9HYPH|nr:hypothetical protein [Aquibium oceanicum]APH70882.1 hypothetical protein BSQ44_05445 [Aquibium oceanicum]
MDWALAIEHNREALRRALALIAAMAGLGGQSAFFRPDSAARRDDPGSEKSKLSPASDCRLPTADRRTLPRRLHRAVLRLLRPAEAAARRLIVIAARGIVLPPLPPRPEEPAPDILRRGSAATGAVWTGIRVGQLGLANLAPPPARRKRNPFRPLPLVDTLRGLPRPGRRSSANGVPRIGLGPRSSFPGPPPSAWDPIDATRLSLRISAIAEVLDDLPRHALRLARWHQRGAAARACGKLHRFSPLRPGRPPGWTCRPAHEVHLVGNEVHGLALMAQERPDTS